MWDTDSDPWTIKSWSGLNWDFTIFKFEICESLSSEPLIMVGLIGWVVLDLGFCLLYCIPYFLYLKASSLARRIASSSSKSYFIFCTSSSLDGNFGLCGDVESSLGLSCWLMISCKYFNCSGVILFILTNFSDS